MIGNHSAARLALLTLVTLAGSSSAMAGGYVKRSCGTCKAAAAGSTAGLQHLKYAPVIDPDGPHLGPSDAHLTLVEYGDFQCPFTDKSRDAVLEELDLARGRVKFYFKPVPLDIHGEMAALVARYYEVVAAIAPERAWDYFNFLFDHRGDIREGGESKLRALTAGFGLSLDTVDAELKAPIANWTLRQGIAEAERYGFQGTPTFVVGRYALSGQASRSDLDHLIAIAKAKAAVRPLRRRGGGQ